jgi:hypothetical protein
MLARLLSGESPISSGLPSGAVWSAERQGQPIDEIPASPIRDSRVGAVVPRNAQHPNAAILLALAEVTPEGQAILDKAGSQTAAWIADTASARFAEENDTATVDLNFLLDHGDEVLSELQAIARGSG